jgi:ABC-type multidrug transport system ATPase subunit
LYTAETALSLQLSTAQLINGIILGVFSCFALTMPIFAVVMHIVNERASGNKQLQTVCGMYTSVYWTANIVWDMFMYTVSVLLMIAFMAALPSTFDTDLTVFGILALMFGASMILFAYVCSFVFATARSALLLIGIGSYFLSVLALLLTFYTTETWYPRLDTFLTLFPPYFLTASLVTLTFQSFLPVSMQQATFSMAVLGDKMIESGAFALKMLLLIVLHESDLAPISRIFRFISHLFSKGIIARLLAADKSAVDSDVLKEETKILSGVDDKKDIVLTVRNLGKFYRRDKKLAVKGVTFGVHKAECFGLLGVNGAGKSTLFQMLCGVHAPTFGDARVLGGSVFGSGGRGRNMSYCPQTDVLFEQLSAREHLLHYARVRGVPSDERRDVVDMLLVGVGLSAQNVHKATASLSGGNKRKVQLAIALLDAPAVILLDEMTTGMDPRARRLAWRALARARTHAGCATVITSHSMEECEQLCDRLVIMVDGRFKCLGGVQYLKDKYGRNYNVKMRLALECDSAKLINTMLGRFSGSVVTEQHVAYLQMQIPVQALLLSTLFDEIHALKENFEIIEFSVSQTTLEHIFVDMVREQDWDGGN